MVVVNKFIIMPSTQSRQSSFYSIEKIYVISSLSSHAPLPPLHHHHHTIAIPCDSFQMYLKPLTAVSIITIYTPCNTMTWRGGGGGGGDICWVEQSCYNRLFISLCCSVAYHANTRTILVTSSYYQKFNITWTPWVTYSAWCLAPVAAQWEIISVT